jgi:hypothetical protein
MPRVTLKSASLLSLLLSSAAVVACSTAADVADAQSANATGGDAQDQASFLHVFAPTDEQPICAGAIIAEKAIVVPRSCVRDGLEVGLASRGDKPFAFNKAKVTKVHVPENGPADIAVLEIEKKLASSANLVTRYPLTDGYTVFARQSVDDGFLGNGVGTTTQISASFLYMTDTQATMQTKSGTSLCERDLGAIVCSSTVSTGLLGGGPRDRCGLAGIVVAPPDGAALDANGCTNGTWKVAPLGIYREFLSQFAPKLFAPIIDASLFGSSTYAPENLWGFDSAGTVKSCSLETTALDAVKKNEKQLVRAKASFTGMAKHADAVAHFGLARKKAPNLITWIPSTRGTLVKTTAFDDSFTADMGAAFDGEYIVSVRISANGGESWTRCDDPAKPLALNVGENAAPAVDGGAPPVDVNDKTDAGAPIVNPPPSADAGAPPVNPTNDAGTAGPQGDDDDNGGDTKEAPPTPAGDDDDDDDKSKPESPASPTKPTKPTKPGGSNNATTPAGSDPVVPATTTTESSGCSTTPAGPRGMFPAVGLLLGLAALVRRRSR